MGNGICGMVGVEYFCGLQLVTKKVTDSVHGAAAKRATTH